MLRIPLAVGLIDPIDYQYYMIFSALLVQSSGIFLPGIMDYLPVLPML